MRILNCDLGDKYLEYISYKKKELSVLNGCLPEIERWNSIIGRVYCIVSGNLCNSFANIISHGKW
jgi:hypothetical protein